MIRRDEVLQGLLALYPAPRYLEVGVFQGTTFHRLTAARKVAVDPAFQFDVAAARRDNPGASYHEVASDAYFGSVVAPDERFDVIYLDGLHTAEQTLRDLMNALAFLDPRGIVVLDDVRPSSHLAAVPDPARYRQLRRRLRNPERAWMGDVYKVVYFIDSFLQQYSWRTVAENHGQTVLWRRRRPEVAGRPIAAVGSMGFDDLILEREVLREAPYGAIVAEVRAALAEA